MAFCRPGALFESCHQRQETMEKANSAYHLGLDLSDFAKAAAEMVMREKQAASPSASEADVALPGRPTTAAWCCFSVAWGVSGLAREGGGEKSRSFEPNIDAFKLQIEKSVYEQQQKRCSATRRSDESA